jgi:hypothetical protein
MDLLSDLYNELSRLGLRSQALEVSGLIKKHADEDVLTDEQLKHWDCDEASRRSNSRQMAKRYKEKGYSMYPCDWLNRLEAKRPENFVKLKGNNVYKSNQISIHELEWILDPSRGHGITKILRFSDNNPDGDGKYDTPWGKLTTDLEKAFAKSRGVEFEFINVHDFGETDRSCGYTTTLAKILPILKEGNVLVHCRAGRDRTGMVIGAHLVHNMNMNPADAWAIVKTFDSRADYWRNMVCKNSGQTAYLAAFYPIDEWCKNELTGYQRKNCKACRNKEYLKSRTTSECYERIKGHADE